MGRSGGSPVAVVIWAIDRQTRRLAERTEREVELLGLAEKHDHHITAWPQYTAARTDRTERTKTEK